MSIRPIRILVVVCASAVAAYAQSTLPSQAFANVRTFTLNGIHNAAMYNFSRKFFGVTLTAGTPVTLNFTGALGGCPAGVNGTDTNHPLFISGGTGTAEVVWITGGTCVSRAVSGTIAFTPTNDHSSEWMLTSATAGLREAEMAAKASFGGISVSPGEYDVQAPWVPDTQFLQVDCYGQPLIKYVGSVAVKAAVIPGTGGDPTRTDGVFGMRFSGCAIEGGAKADDSMYVNGAHHVVMSYMQFRGALNKCLETGFSVGGLIEHPRCSVNEQAWSVRPKNGFYFGNYDSTHATTTYTVDTPFVEGTSSSGIVFDGTLSIKESSGTSESNGRCFDILNLAKYTSVDGLDCEDEAAGSVSTSGNAVRRTSGVPFDAEWIGLAMTINEIDYTIDNVTDGDNLVLVEDAGSQTGVQYSVAHAAWIKVIDSYSSEIKNVNAPHGLTHIESARLNKISGGQFFDITIDSTAAATIVEDALYIGSRSSLLNNGSRTCIRHVQYFDVDSASFHSIDNCPVTFEELLSDAEPQGSLRNVFLATDQTGPFEQIFDRTGVNRYQRRFASSLEFYGKPINQGGGMFGVYGNWNSDAPGGIVWNRWNGSSAERLGSMGFSPRDITLTLSNGAGFVISGGNTRPEALQVGSGSVLLENLHGTMPWTVTRIADGAIAQAEVRLIGVAATGWSCSAAHSDISLQAVMVSASPLTDNVEVTILNKTGRSLSLSGTLQVDCWHY